MEKIAVIVRGVLLLKVVVCLCAKTQTKPHHRGPTDSGIRANQEGVDNDPDQGIYFAFACLNPDVIFAISRLLRNYVLI